MWNYTDMDMMDELDEINGVFGACEDEKPTILKSSPVRRSQITWNSHVRDDKNKKKYPLCCSPVLINSESIKIPGYGWAI